MEGKSQYLDLDELILLMVVPLIALVRPGGTVAFSAGDSFSEMENRAVVFDIRSSP